MVKYQTFRRRFWAGVIDGFVFLPFTIFYSYFILSSRKAPVLILWIIFSHSIYWSYSVFFHSRYGQTIGKMVLHLKVLDISETRIPTFKQALLRDAGGIAQSYLEVGNFIFLVTTGIYFRKPKQFTTSEIALIILSLVWYTIEIRTLAKNRERRAFHDLLAKTVVVRTNV
jgi:uncharacterized RDD family membrane protein YckC